MWEASPPRYLCQSKEKKKKKRAIACVCLNCNLTSQLSVHFPRIGKQGQNWDDRSKRLGACLLVLKNAVGIVANIKVRK